MKKIKSIQQLQSEKKRLRLQQQYLEQKMQQNWQDLRSELHPSTLAGSAITQFISHKTAQNLSNHNSILKSTVAYGISLLAKKLVNKASTAITNKFSKNTAA